MAIIFRIGLIAWGLFFGFIGVRGIINPHTFTEVFGLVGEGAARNALRAAYGTFSLVCAIPAIWVALQPSRLNYLHFPIILFSAVLGLRIFGIGMGDAPNMTAMLTEAASIALLLGGYYFLRAPKPA